jgi:hypothetical protein
MENLETKFMREIANIKDPEFFFGVLKILKVELMEKKEGEEEETPRDFVALFEDCMAHYAAAPRKRRRELLRILRDANKEAAHYADRTENTEAKN